MSTEVKKYFTMENLVMLTAMAGSAIIILSCSAFSSRSAYSGAFDSCGLPFIPSVTLFTVTLLILIFIQIIQSKKVGKKALFACVAFALTIIVSYLWVDMQKNEPVLPDSGCDENGQNCWQIEEHGKIAVAKLPETQRLATEYGKENVKISALYYKLIEDQNYVKRLIGDQYKSVDCLIPVESPEGKVLYIETIDDGIENYTKISWSEFEAMLEGVSEADRAVFFSNINDTQNYVREYLP